MTSPAPHREAGFSVIMAVIVIALVGTIIGVLMQTAGDQRRESSRSLVRAEQIAIADTAVSRYLGALNSKAVGRKTNFQLTTDAFTGPTSPLRPYIDRDELRIYPYAVGATSFTSRAAGRQCTSPLGTIPTPRVVRREGALGANWPVDDSGIGQTRFIVEENHPGRTCAYWEVYRVDPFPLASLQHDISSHRFIGVIFRVWSAASTTRTGGQLTVNPRYVRTTLSRGSFSDYQLLTDEQIRFGTGVTITGKVHSNNYDEASPAISGPASITCTGNEAKVTARNNGIGFANAACRPNGNTQRAIDLGAMSLAVADLKTACADDPGSFRTRCYGSLGGTGYDVEVGSTIIVRNRATGGEIARHNPGGRPFAMLFEEDVVYVRDGAGPTYPAGSVTIFASSDDVSNIRIVGKSFGPPTASKPVVGLLAQGDIIIDAVEPSAGMPNPSANCDLVTINAAMMAETGTLTVPPKWLSQIRQRKTPKCGTLRVNGAISTRTMPLLQMVWNETFGFAGRELNWNNQLKRVVPPMYPATGPWEMGTWREANHDCLGITDPNPASGCEL